MKIINQLESIASQLPDYTEFRVQHNFSQSITYRKGDLIGNQSSSQKGMSSRSFDAGYWGFASAPEANASVGLDLIKESQDNAHVLAKYAHKKDLSIQSKVVTKTFDFASTKSSYAQSEKIDFVKSIDAFIEKNFKDLINYATSLRLLNMEKQLYTSFGSSFYSFIPRSLLYVSMSVEKDNEVTDLYMPFAQRGEMQDVFGSPDTLFPKISELYENLKKKQEGVFASAGEKDVVLGSELAGILAHEAIGHTTEADLVLGGSVAGQNLNKEIASPMVNMVDFAHTAFGETLPVPVYVDDEGTESKDAVLIQDGILKTFMNNKETAAHLDHELTGNARAFGFYDEPLVRMRNTAILPGKDKLDDMISSIDDGYYLVNSSNGQADTTSEFMFGVPLGFEIKNGKIGKAIRDTTISGVAFDMLKTISMISDEMTWDCAGMCGKKQNIPVGMGGPAIKCKINIGGR